MIEVNFSRPSAVERMFLPDPIGYETMSSEAEVDEIELNQSRLNRLAF